MLENLRDQINTLRSQHIIRRSVYQKALSDIPDNLFGFWQTKASREFPGIPRDAVFFTQAAEGLMLFFDYVKHSEQACALPSKAADSVWHAWSALSQAGLGMFCRKHFGRDIPHIEASEMAETMDTALAATLVQARQSERMTLASNSVPSLFALDRKLKMPGGYAYQAAAGKFGYRNLNSDGAAEGKMIFPPGLDVMELMTAGFISAAMYEVYRRQAEAAARANAVTSSSDGGSSFDMGSSCDAGSSGDASSSCDSGSSCGSSCGSS